MRQGASTSYCKNTSLKKPAYTGPLLKSLINHNRDVPPTKGWFLMTEKQLYIQCHELLSSINLQEIIDDAFLKIVKNNLQSIQSEPEESYKTAWKVLFTGLSILRDQFKSTDAYDGIISKMAS